MTEPAITALTTDFDLDGWIDGTCKVTITAKIYQRGDLVTRLDEIKREWEIVKATPKDQRSVTDKSPDVLADEWEKLAEELTRTAMTVHVQDRTDERRRGIRDRMVKEHKLDLSNDDDVETIILHQMADAIVKVEAGGVAKEFPDGFPAAKLRAMKDALGDAALSPLRDAYFKVISEAPTISAPLSRNSSSGRGGGI